MYRYDKKPAYFLHEHVVSRNAMESPRWHSFGGRLQAFAL
jgi:hypothetical protein